MNDGQKFFEIKKEPGIDIKNLLQQIEANEQALVSRLEANDLDLSTRIKQDQNENNSNHFLHRCLKFLF